MTRAKLAALIDDGKTDRQIFDLLVKERGPLLLKPHLLKELPSWTSVWTKPENFHGRQLAKSDRVAIVRV